jgi:hypothetical protein
VVIATVRSGRSPTLERAARVESIPNISATRTEHLTPTGSRRLRIAATLAAAGGEMARCVAQRFSRSRTSRTLIVRWQYLLLYASADPVDIAVPPSASSGCGA